MRGLGEGLVAYGTFSLRDNALKARDERLFAQRSKENELDRDLRRSEGALDRAARTEIETERTRQFEVQMENQWKRLEARLKADRENLQKTIDAQGARTDAASRRTLAVPLLESIAEAEQSVFIDPNKPMDDPMNQQGLQKLQELKQERESILRFVETGEGLYADVPGSTGKEYHVARGPDAAPEGLPAWVKYFSPSRGWGGSRAEAGNEKSGGPKRLTEMVRGTKVHRAPGDKTTVK